MTRPRILLTGGSGQVGWELRRTLAPLGEVIAPGRDALDLSRPESLRNVVRQVAPALVVNAGAYTAVDAAEGDADLARRVNAEAPGVLAQEAAACGALIVHYSTDYVFDGRKSVPYKESDATGPASVYGSTKLDGERAVAAAGGPHLIFRTGWVYGLRGKNFLRTMLRLARERDELRVVDDQHGAPTWSRMLAEATAGVLAAVRSVDGFSIDPGRWGVYHATAAGETTWCRFAAAILEADPGRHEQRCGAPSPITTAEYPTPATRPRYSVLDNGRLAREVGIVLPAWETQLEMCMEDRAAEFAP